MTEDQFRAAVVEEAKLWLGTPYRNVGRIRGVGANCAQLLYGIYTGAGILHAPEPRWYTPQFHVHSKDERLIEYVKAYGGVEIEESQVKSADVVLFRTGKSFGHGAIILDFPTRMIHTLKMTGCVYGHCTEEGSISRFKRRYFTLWSPA